MAPPSVYLDECVNQHIVAGLRLRGFRVTTAQAEAMLGVTDEAQLVHATQRGFVILSHNRRDFQRWHAILRQRAQSHGGILLVPNGSEPQLEVRTAMLLDWIATLPDYRSQLFRWHDLQYWLTQGHRLPGYSEAEVRLALGQQP